MLANFDKKSTDTCPNETKRGLPLADLGHNFAEIVQTWATLGQTLLFLDVLDQTLTQLGQISGKNLTQRRPNLDELCRHLTQLG